MTCPCKYPLMIIDNRDGENIEFLSFPVENVEDDGGVQISAIDIVNTEGFDGKLHNYVAITWRDPSNATTKKYDVADHIVIAGCEAKVDGSTIQCEKKELYVVLHPLDEWIDYHIVELK